MVWTIEFTDRAARQFSKIDKPDQLRIAAFLRDRLAPLADPRGMGKALKGSALGGYWRFRVGDFRLICELQDSRLVVVIVEIGHRREVYR